MSSLTYAMAAVAGAMSLPMMIWDNGEANVAGIVYLLM